MPICGEIIQFYGGPCHFCLVNSVFFFFLKKDEKWTHFIFTTNPKIDRLDWIILLYFILKKKAYVGLDLYCLNF